MCVCVDLYVHKFMKIYKIIFKSSCYEPVPSSVYV